MHEGFSNKKKLSITTLACMIVCFFSNMSYLPYFTTSGLTQKISYPVWGLLLVVLCLQGALYISRRDIRLLILIVIICTSFLLLELCTGKSYLNSLLTRCIIIAMVIFFIGGMVASKGRDEFDEHKVFGAYIVSAVILSVTIYFTYLQGQDLNSSLYVYKSKNEVAFINITAIIMILYSRQNMTRIKNAIKIFLLFFFVCIIGMMRCRSMLIAVVCVIGIYMLQKKQSKTIKAAVVVGMVILLFALRSDDIYDTIINGIIFAGRDSTNIDSLSSGRTIQIDMALMKFLESPIVGTGDTSTVDCFFVSVMMQYGMIIGPILIGLAFYPFIWGVVYYKKTKINLVMVMTLCSFVYIIGGIFEENAPFGPGVRCYISWFLFGYLRMYTTRERIRGK